MFLSIGGNHLLLTDREYFYIIIVNATDLDIISRGGTESQNTETSIVATHFPYNLQDRTLVLKQ